MNFKLLFFVSVWITGTWFHTGAQIRRESDAPPSSVVIPIHYSELSPAGTGQVILLHHGISTNHPTIQDAVDASVTGDTVKVGEGTYVEQITITKGITLWGTDSSQTVIRSPLSADLVQSGGNWKNLKAQDVYAVIGVKTDNTSRVVIRNLTVDGYDQGYLPDVHYPDKNAYAFDGIAVLNSNALIEAVHVTRVRELATDYGQYQPGYLPEDQPAGMNHNEGIFAESAAGTPNHLIEIRNSLITKYQKTGILAWGPTLVVNIHHNTIRGYGKTLYSTGNAIQIASSDRSSMGGNNGDRRGTKGIVSHNSITDVGIIIPEPGQPGSYLNLGLGGSTGVLLWQAGDSFLIRGNTITRADYIPSWHSSATSNDGGYSNQAVDVVSVEGAVVDSNTFINFDHGLMIETANEIPDVTAIANASHGNTHDYFSGTGNDRFSLDSLPEVVAYYAVDNGHDTITGFGAGDRIYVNDYNKTGCVNGLLNGWPTVSFTGGEVTEGDGLSVTPNSLQIARGSGCTDLFIDTDSTPGPAEITITLKGKYYTENFLIAGGYISFQAWEPCINPSYGGKVYGNQQICQTEIPDTIVSDSLATGYEGTPEYQWQSADFPDSLLFSDIPESGDPFYVPSSLTRTTWFRRLARVNCKTDWSGAAVAGPVKISVDAVPVAGTLSGDTMICHGSTSVLTLSGDTGTIVGWQSSVNGTEWFDIPGSTTSTFTLENVTSDKYYRASVSNGTCSEVYTDPIHVHVIADFRISGVARYFNNPKTPLNGLKVILKKNSAAIDSVVTTSTGYYEFDSLTNGNFSLVIKSSHPSGQWQTWGGVNMTDYLLTYKHATTGPQLPALPPVVRISGDVKAPQTPPLINTLDASAIQMAAKYGWGNPAYFQIPKWVFSGVTGTIDAIPLNCADIAFDLRGLCAGDVNGTFLPPNGNKMAEPGLTLVNRGVVALREEMTFPVTASQTAMMGALTLMLNYDPTHIEIIGVDMPENAGTLPWFVAENGVLSIGWASVVPVVANAGQPLLMIRARLTGATDLIRFTLNDNPLSELADGEGNVIEEAILTMPVAKSNDNGPGQPVNIMYLTLYPNPATTLINAGFILPDGGDITIDVMNLQGQVVATVLKSGEKAGWQKLTVDVQSLPNGVYFLRVSHGGAVETRKFVVNR